MDLEGKKLKCISDKFSYVTFGKLYPIFIYRDGTYVYRDDDIGDKSGIHHINTDKGMFWNMFEIVD